MITIGPPAFFVLTATRMGVCSQTLKMNLVASKIARKVPFTLDKDLPEFLDSIPEQVGGAHNQTVRCTYFLDHFFSLMP